MPFAVYLTLVVGALSEFKGDVRAPIAIEAGGFGHSVGAFVAPDWLRIEFARYMSGKTRTGSTSGMDDRLTGPPPSPGEEPRLTTDSTGVVAHCDAMQAALEKRGMKFIRKVVSENPKYGVVWRADTTMTGYESAQSRLICWKRPGHDDYSFISHPLVMFDPSELLAPLEP